ncbi:hypothetical protein [Persicitalea jodogahamensis]|uniref:Uncharacterized protein n=1 Tax=Persicitalea jodogahamensis TaxID=402147 RepID=A0A8J3D326_9BACT|nr:hypothetical protein [Persicitalea jodogahamensis]GHB65226.1 hypothetical protein GCM10007390_19150 [Persicitalea jodogahamensis]
MKKTALPFTSVLIWLVLAALTTGLSCKSDNDAEPDPTTQLTGKWWCDDARILADQYFNPDGTFQQRFNGTTETGKWRFSPDKKTILVSDVAGNVVGSWSYSLIEVSASKLVLSYFSNASFSPCP